MDLTLDMELLRGRLEASFGLSMTSGILYIDGGNFPIIRLDGIEAGSGFCIVVARTHRQVEASFKADNFAGGFLRRMGEADQSAIKTFNTLVSQARKNSAQVYIAINGNAIDDLPEPRDLWRRFELDVSKRISSVATNQNVVADLALSITSHCLSLILTLLGVDSRDETILFTKSELPEGALIRIEVNRYERSPANRAACIAHYGAACQICKNKFSDIYGDLGKEYIEVHHKTPISKMGGEYFIDPINDLIPVCSNCHSMLHRRNPPLEPEELMKIINQLK